MTKSIFLDTDPGHDDALAIMLLAGSPSVHLAHITTVAGNATVPKTTRNARAVLNVIQRNEIPVYSGAHHPLTQSHTEADVHGPSGLDGFDVSNSSDALTNDAIARIIDASHTAPEQSPTLVTIGPLTNIALALRQDPSLLTRLSETIIMGGVITDPGNQNRVAEFNVCTDPDAADIVFRAPGKKILIPLDVCNNVIIQLNDLHALPDTQTVRAVRSMLQPYIRNIQTFLNVTGALLYDPIAAFYAVSPESFTLTPMHIVIETTGTHTRGMTVVERRTYMNQEPNILVATALDVPAFLNALLTTLARHP